MAKILLVEDDKSLREIYGVRLMAEGYEIVSAGDGEEALAVAIKERPNLIVSDVMMPKISGFDMLDILRSTTETKDIKVIMMTALSSDDQRARGEALGADRYLVKSQVGIEDVVRTVHDVMGDGVAGAAPAPSFTSTVPAEATASPVATPAPVADMTPPVLPQAPSVPAPVAPLPEPSLPPVINAASTPAPAAQFVPIPAPAAPVSMPFSQPVSQPAPLPTPAPQPYAPVAPVTPAPEPVTLPQPTAPFSSPAPASLGDRIINPISPMDTITTPANIAEQMNQELNGTPAAPQAAPTQLPPQPPAIPPAPGAAL